MELFMLMMALCSDVSGCTEGTSPEPMTEAACVALVDPATDMLIAEVQAAKYDYPVSIYVACVEYTATI